MKYWRIRYSFDGFPHYGESVAFKWGRSEKEAIAFIKKSNKTGIKILEVIEDDS